MQYKNPEILKNTMEFAFGNSLVNSQRDVLRNLLDDKGVFEIQNRNLRRVEVGKNKFLKWIFGAVTNVDKIAFYLDECTGCKKGCPIVMFNYGRFPVAPKDSSEFEKTGFSITVKGNKIIKIEFCHKFKDTSNNYVFMNNIHKKIKAYMRQNSCSKEQAEKDIKENIYLYLNL